jgi:stage II sporulation protein D
VRNVGRHRKDGFDFCSDVHCQAYQGMSVEKEIITQAVDDTRGEILTFNDKPIETFYHANCGGVLRADAFGDFDYLSTKTDSINDFLPESAYGQEIWFFDDPETFCSRTHNSKFRWQRVYDSEDFLLAFGYDIKKIEKLLPLEKSRSLRYDAVGVSISGDYRVIRGDLKIRSFFDSLKSSAFVADVKYSKDGTPEMLFFWGGGFGHGSGLCQEGAREMAQESFDYKDILKHYYPGAQIKKNF